MDIEARIASSRARRAAAGLAIRYLMRDGTETTFYAPTEERKTEWLTKLAVQGRTVLDAGYDRRAFLAAEYVNVIGYDPFEDDPTISEDEVASTLLGWEAEVAANA
jgi:hypothetical protein